MVHILLEGGARIDIKDSDGWTFLMTAVKERQFDAFHKLLRHRKQSQANWDVFNTPDIHGITPLMLLVDYEPEQLVIGAQ